MRIVEIRALPLAVPALDRYPGGQTSEMGRQVLVRLQTDDGLTGWGECFAYGAPLAVCRVIDDELSPLLVGRDASDIEAIVRESRRHLMTWGRRGLGMFALSGIELALWDLKGKACGRPVAELLGGVRRHRVRAYASLPRFRDVAAVERAVGDAVAQGFTAIKVHQNDLASVAAARRVAGDSVELMLDVNCAWSAQEAIETIRRLESLRLGWVEEPVWPPEDYDSLRRVRAEVRTPVACGENESTCVGFSQAVRACDFVQPSVTKIGGLLEMQRVGALAAAVGVAVAPHSYYLGPGLAATLQFISSTPEVSLIEMASTELALPLLLEPVRATGGFVEVSTRPGLGADPNPEALARYIADGNGI